MLLVGWGLSFVAPLDVATQLGATVTGWGSAVPTDVARWLTRLGDLWVVAVLGLLVALAVRGSAVAGRIWLLLLTTGVGITLLTAALKLLTSRPRPVDGLVETFSSSYPSGHATRAAAMYGLAAWAFHRWGRPGLQRWLGVAAGSALVAGVALSRLWLGVHRPSEVAMGVTLGLVWLVVVVGTLAPEDDAGHEEEAGW